MTASHQCNFVAAQMIAFLSVYLGGNTWRFVVWVVQCADITFHSKDFGSVGISKLFTLCESIQACRNEAKASGAAAVEAKGTSRIETPSAMNGSGIVTAGDFM